MKVELITYTPDPEKIVAAAAKLCYSSSGVLNIKENLTDLETAKFLKKIISLGHLSTIEHVFFTFGIEGVSRNLSHQLVRHRIASYSQKSQRYVNEQGFSYIIPPSIANDKVAEEIFINKMSDLQSAYEKLVELVPKEDARYVLPSACETKLVATFNARSLMNFFEHRLCQRAQWEIRELAYEMLKLVKKVAPSLFQIAGPTCYTKGKCYEGKMSCGQASKVKKIIENL